MNVVFAERAEIIRGLCAKHFNIEVSKDKSGVERLDQLLNAMHKVMQPSASDSEELNLVCESLGVLFGEIIRQCVGGRWAITEANGQRFAVVELETRTKITAMHTVGKQFLNGRSDSILFAFGLSLKIAEAARRVANLSPEEREARRQRGKEELRKINEASRRKPGLPAGKIATEE